MPESQKCWVNGFVGILFKFGWELCLIFWVCARVCSRFNFLVFLCLIFGFVLEIFGFVLIFWVCILWVLKVLGAQFGFFLSSHIRFFLNLFFNQSMVFLGFG